MTIEPGSLLPSLFLAGLVGGASHCVGMCGPFVVAQSLSAGDRQQKTSPLLHRLAGKALLPYHFGRMTSYVLLGMIAALLSKQIMGTPLARVTSSALLVLAGIIFIASAFPELRRYLSFMRIKPVEKIGRFLGSVAFKLFNSSDVSGRYGLGIMLGFLPCGLVVAALMAVATTGNVLTAAIGMIAFAVGTMPALMAISFGSGQLRALWPSFFKKMSKIVMTLSGINLFFLAAKAMM